MHVYHYSDTARLPWIVDSGELKPMPFHGPIEFLWATTSDKGDKTATSSHSTARAQVRKGNAQSVRYTLHAEDFEPWQQVTARHADWTPEFAASLTRTTSPADVARWVCREHPLPLARVVAVHTRGYVSEWRELQWPPRVEIVPPRMAGGANDARAVLIGGKAYIAARARQLRGSVGMVTSYSVADVVSAESFDAMLARWR